jgi:hypothetical protein
MEFPDVSKFSDNIPFYRDVLLSLDNLFPITFLQCTWDSIQVFCAAETVVDAEEHYEPGRHHG